MIKTTKQKGEFGMKRTVYEAPVTELFRVELEGTFMSASIYEEEKHQSGVSSSAQEYETFDGAAGFVLDDNGIKWE
jgi:hypothetical protein